MYKLTCFLFVGCTKNFPQIPNSKLGIELFIPYNAKCIFPKKVNLSVFRT